MDPPKINLIKSNTDDKSDKAFVKIKLSRDMTSEKLDLYDFKMNSLDNGEQEEFLFFIRTFNMIIEASETILAGGKIKYRCTLLHQFDTLFAGVGSGTS